ncbi:MAG: response regulator [Thermoanaerobaculaceae bacterium]|jgi:DNA-binding NarL/FixJ family response regulator|nr:response regulator [Thermoanaerobaculaceae bacterium]
MTVNILIVEDHSGVRRTLRQWLESALPGCTLRETDNGTDAVELVCQQAPTFVLMDLNLPGMGGLESTRAIKAASPSTFVVIVSIEDTTASRRAAAAAGAAAYVAKDRMGFELLPVLRRLLAGAGPVVGLG